MTEAGEASPSFEDLQQAADWFAVLQGGAVSEEERQEWQRWLDTGPRQRVAWDQVLAVADVFAGAANPLARQVLERRPAVSRQRRTVRRALLVAPAAVLAGWTLSQFGPWRGWGAAYRTDTGEQRAVALSDGSELWLNTATALDVDYSATLRRLVLHRGEVLITSGHDPSSPPRPLVVDVAPGRLTALGTRFSVRYQDDGGVSVDVFEGAVRVAPRGRGEPVVVPAGRGALLLHDRVDLTPGQPGALPDWQRGMLVADGMRLGDFIAELRRYRRGYLACAPEVADLRIVGSYPLADTDRILSALQATLPVQVRQPMPWWTVVEARASPAAGAAAR
ncbi:FecR family protein [Acidovorax sp. SUPP950]|uniref:FecR family protein n=1 Tax=Acidovorax sp. SUPP950 TaxID=511901 RepID=UPI0023CC47B2|nr:FecR family protein [Acidovorax sp. SUPP950]GKS73543.1 FecR family protein [Acidovorax sp. SUPP950]